MAEVDEIERNGGYVASIENGNIYEKISDYFSKEQQALENGEIKVVGYNTFKSQYTPPPIKVFKYPEGVEEKQKMKLKELRKNRDNNSVKNALDALKTACKEGKNILPYTIQCARVRCTEGEQFEVFTKSFGKWHPNSVV